MDASVIGNVLFQSTVGSGNPINQWTDLSGNGAHFVKATANQPDWLANRQNGLGAVSFVAGSFEHLENLAPPIASATPGHMFVVLKSVGAESVNQGFGAFGPNTSGDFYTNGAQALRSSFGSIGQHECGTYSTSASWRLLEFHSATSDWAAVINGSTQLATATNTVGWFSGFYFGVNRQSIYGSYEMGEVALYNAKQVATVATIRSYFNTKWALGF